MSKPFENSLIDVSLIGFGEAAQAFVSGWQGAGNNAAIRTYDVKTDHAITADAKWDDYTNANVTGCQNIDTAVEGIDIVFSFVTADQAFQAAQATAAVIKKGAMFFDCNSCAPDTKRASAYAIQHAGAVYVDTAVMAPVHPKLHQTPLLLAGSDTDRITNVINALGLNANIVSNEIGKASAIKMMRSVMIKGMEALTLECMLGARKAGVDTDVVASLDASFPNWDWASKASYNFERTTTHGVRRAAEMLEVAKTLSDLGLNNAMSRATAEWQAQMGALNLALNGTEFGNNADEILDALKEQSS